MYFASVSSKNSKTYKHAKYINKQISHNLALDVFFQHFESRLGNTVFNQHMDANPNVNYAILESAISDCHKLAYKNSHIRFNRKNIALMSG